MSNAAVDPTNFADVRDWMVNRDRATVARANLARYLRDNPNGMPELIGRLCDTAPLQVIRAVTDTEAGELPVVRDLNEYAPGAAADAGARGQTFAAGGSSQPAAEVPHRKEMP
jgi:hypothetical protein